MQETWVQILPLSDVVHVLKHIFLTLARKHSNHWVMDTLDRVFSVSPIEMDPLYT